MPANSGDRIYSGQLATAFAAQNSNVLFLGFDDSDPPATAGAPPLSWLPVRSRKKSYALAFFSMLPLVAASLGTSLMRMALRESLTQSWDVIVLDNYATVWALAEVIQARRRDPRIVVVHVSHNFETSLAKSLYDGYSGSWIKKIVLLTNYWKIKYWESEIFSQADIITAITEEDAQRILPMTKPDALRLVLTPGYSGSKVKTRNLHKSQRRVVLVGSFRWVVKQENLRSLLDLADNLFHEHGIGLDIVGDVPSEVREEYGSRLRATIFHGFVDDYAAIFASSRVAIVPEIIGGGFKLKILDYIFGGLPVAALSQASAGLPEEVRKNFMTADTLEALIAKIVANIDNIDLLDEMQINAGQAAANLFSWTDRGRDLLVSISSKRAKKK